MLTVLQALGRKKTGSYKNAIHLSYIWTAATTDVQLENVTFHMGGILKMGLNFLCWKGTHLFVRVLV